MAKKKKRKNKEELTILELSNLAEAQLEIDLNNLHHECEEQPKLYKRWSKRYAQAKYKLEELKDNLVFTEAEALLDIAANPKKFKLPKTTDQTVKAAIPIHPDVVEAKRNKRKQAYKVGVLGGILEAFGQRKSMCGEEVKLFMGNYFAKVPKPKIKDDPDHLLGNSKKRKRRK